MWTRLLCVAFLCGLFFACNQDAKNGWSEHNLMRYNVPIAISAPDSVKISTAEVSGIVRDVTVEDLDNDYSIQIFSGQAFTNDIARLKADQLDLVRGNPYFNRIVEEEPAGFIFENQIDSTSSFGFRYVIYQGDLEIIVQNGMGKIFSEESVRKMYEGVKQ